MALDLWSQWAKKVLLCLGCFFLVGSFVRGPGWEAWSELSPRAGCTQLEPVSLAEHRVCGHPGGDFVRVALAGALEEALGGLCCLASLPSGSLGNACPSLGLGFLCSKVGRILHLLPEACVKTLQEMC